MVVYALLLAAAALLFTRVPAGFVPAPDKQYLIGVAQLLAGASLDRTEAVIRQLSDIALKVPGIVDSVAFPGLSIAGFSAAPNEGIVFFSLAPFEQRTTPKLSNFDILGQVNDAIQQIQGARMFVVRRRRWMGSDKRAVSKCRCKTVAARASKRCSARYGECSDKSTAIPSPASARPTPLTISTCHNCSQTSIERAPSKWVWR